MSLNVKLLDTSIHQKFSETFDCGNSFFKGSEALDLGIGVTYVLMSDDDTEMLGYYNLTTGAIREAEKPQNRIGGSIN